MRKIARNWAVWLGFVFSIVAFGSYFFVFARFPVTRNVPWANLLLFGFSAAFMWAGWRRVVGAEMSSDGKVTRWTLVLLSVSIFGAFCFVIFHATRQLPAARGAPKIGQRARDFVLRDTNGNLVSLSNLLSVPLSSSNGSRIAPKGVFLIFYRGYW